MSIADRLFNMVQRGFTLSQRVDELAKVVAETSTELRYVNERLIRVETVIEMSGGGGPPPPPPPPPAHPAA